MITSIEEFKKAEELFSSAHYKEAAAYYSDTLKILRLPRKKYEWEAADDKQLEAQKDSEINFKIYDRLIHSYIYTDKLEARDLLHITREMFSEKFQFQIKLKYAVISMLMEDLIEAETVLQELHGDQKLTEVQKAYVCNNLAMSKFFMYHNAKRSARGKDENIDDKAKQREKEIIPLLKDSIRIYETLQPRNEEDMKVLDALCDRGSFGPEEFYQEAGKQQFFATIQNSLSGLPLTNL